MITNSRAYIPFAAVALIAGVLGWGVSAFSNKQTAEAMPANMPAQVSNLALTQPQAQTGILPDGQVVSLQPLQTPQGAAGQPPTYTAQPLTPIAVVPAGTQQPFLVQPAPATVIQNAPVATRTVVRNTSAGTSYTRKRGMSNKTKALIAIGGGAGVGAAIGGIAKGGKGAAIGALAGGGAGAIYSLIKHKKHQPIF